MEMSRHRRQVEVMEPAYKLLTVEDFLDCCPSDQRHYQLFDARRFPVLSDSAAATRLMPGQRILQASSKLSRGERGNSFDGSP